MCIHHDRTRANIQHLVTHALTTTQLVNSIYKQTVQTETASELIHFNRQTVRATTEEGLMSSFTKKPQS